MYVHAVERILPEFHCIASTWPRTYLIVTKHLIKTCTCKVNSRTYSKPVLTYWLIEYVYQPILSNNDTMAHVLELFYNDAEFLEILID